MGGAAFQKENAVFWKIKGDGGFKDLTKFENCFFS